MNVQPLALSGAANRVDPAFAWVREDWIDFVLAKVSPMLTYKRVMATVSRVERIQDGMVKLILKPNKKFKGYIPGQFVLLTVRIDGVLQQRSYSVINYKNNQLTLGIKVQGAVSNYVADTLSVGDVIEISQAQGDFVLDKSTEPCLFIASGSGITPMLPMLKQALSRANSPVTLLYYSRDHAFSKELSQLEKANPHFNAVLINTTIAHEHFSKEHLIEYCSDFKNREVYVCGALGLMRTTREVWQAEKLSHKLHQEMFVMDAVVSEDAVVMPVTFRRSVHNFEAKGSLLLSAEAAGLKPAHGCRMGVCNTCVCTKVSGTVRNQLTGELDHQPNTQVRLCISEAVTPVVFDI